jgi:hypothetical protein
MSKHRKIVVGTFVAALGLGGIAIVCLVWDRSSRSQAVTEEPIPGSFSSVGTTVRDPTGAVTIVQTSAARNASDATLELPFLGSLPAHKISLNCRLSYDAGATKADWKLESYLVNGKLVAVEYTRTGTHPRKKDLSKWEEGYRGHDQEILALSEMNAELAVVIDDLFHYAKVDEVDYLFIFAGQLRETGIRNDNPSTSRVDDAIIATIFAKDVMPGGAAGRPVDAMRLIYNREGKLLRMDTLTYGF